MFSPLALGFEFEHVPTLLMNRFPDFRFGGDTSGISAESLAGSEMTVEYASPPRKEWDGEPQNIQELLEARPKNIELG